MASQKTNTPNKVFQIESGSAHKIFDVSDVKKIVARATAGYESDIDIDKIIQMACKSLFDGMTFVDFNHVIVLATVPFSEIDQAYSFVAARLLNYAIFYEVTGLVAPENKKEYEIDYKKAFIAGIHHVIKKNIFSDSL